MFKKRDRVGDHTHAASEIGKDALAQASAILQQAQEYLAPRAQDALHQASDYIAPKAEKAKQQGARYAAQAADAARPKVNEAYTKVAPKIDDARSKVQDGLLPALAMALHNAADDVAGVELPKVPGSLVKEEKPKKGVFATLGKLLLATGLVAGIAFAIKKFLEPTDAGWQAHEPSQPYVPTSTETLVDDLSTSSSTTEEPAEDDAAPFAGSPYGEGSYVGSVPPEGFTIKGNERSMKYHVEGNGGYERTIADVWFADEASAEAAGFTKAQR